jgi:integration host factor subunit alpha
MADDATLTRAHLAQAIFNKIGFSRAEASEIVDVVLNEMSEALSDEGKLKLSSFGTFEVREKKERIGRNPKTKVEVSITPRKVVSFHASPLLKQRLNQDSGSASAA